MQWRFKARNGRGQLIEGFREHLNAQGLAIQLKSEGLFPLLIQPYREEIVSWMLGQSWLRRLLLPDDRIIFFCKYLLEWLREGRSLPVALAKIHDVCDDSDFQKILLQIHNRVDAGQTLSYALSLYPKIFPAILVKLMSVAEKDGRLEPILERCIQEFIHRRDLNRKLLIRLRYPLWVGGLIVMALILVGFTLLPELAHFFTHLKIELPWPTQALIGFSTLLQQYQIYWGLLGSFCTASLLWWYQTPRGERYLDYKILRLPVLGHLIEMLNLLRMSRVLSLCLGAGIRLEHALMLASHQVTHTYYRNRLQRMSKQVEQGLSWAPLIHHASHFSPLLYQIVVRSQQPSDWSPWLLEAAHHFERDMDASIRLFVQRFESILLGFIAFIVLWLAIAVLWPMGHLLLLF